VLQRAQAALGRNDELEVELAQLRAAMGLWVLAAQSWRRAVVAVPHFEQAAVFSLASTAPEQRDTVLNALAGGPLLVPAVRVAAALDVMWGFPERGWQRLAGLRADSAAIAAWLAFADRAEEARAWLPARDALTAVANAQPSDEVLLRGMRAALAGGDAASAAQLGRRVISGGSAGAISEALPSMMRALGAQGRTAEAERLFSAHEQRLFPEHRDDARRQLAWAWVRAGDTNRARELLGAGESAGEVEGWLALYDGALADARAGLTRAGVESSPQHLAAVAVLTRTQAERSPAVGKAFLAVARGDTNAAAAAFEEAARELPDAGSLLLLQAARLHSARGSARAVVLWHRIADVHAASPEAPEALLEWGRALHRSGDAAGAIERLEQLILSYPRSALLPQARRELEQARMALRRSTN
jgi:tetratricopeptide (TPR) repeat protein